MKNIDWGLRVGDLCQKDVANARGLNGCENDTIFVAFDERPHTDAGRREAHFLAFTDKACQLRNQYVIGDFHSETTLRQTQGSVVYST